MVEEGSRFPSRVIRSRRSARAAYDHLSGWYDLLAGSEQRFNHQLLAMLDPRPGERVLELGFGTGHSLFALASRGCRVYGADVSSGMARAARRRLLKANLLSCARINQADGRLLPFVEGSFDVVFTAFTLELFDTPEIPTVLGAFWRVLRPGGRLGVAALSLPEKPGVMVRLYEWFHRVLPEYVDCRPIPAAGCLRQGGFQIHQVELKSMWGLPVEIVVGSK